jgi:hypothetical protein
MLLGNGVHAAWEWASYCQNGIHGDVSWYRPLETILGSAYAKQGTVRI